MFSQTTWFVCNTQLFLEICQKQTAKIAWLVLLQIVLLIIIIIWSTLALAVLPCHYWSFNKNWFLCLALYQHDIFPPSYIPYSPGGWKFKDQGFLWRGIFSKILSSRSITMLHVIKHNVIGNYLSSKRRNCLNI